MGKPKSNKNETNSPVGNQPLSIQNKDTLLRINYLYEVASILENDCNTFNKDGNKNFTQRQHSLVRYYCSIIKKCSKKTVQRL